MPVTYARTYAKYARIGVKYGPTWFKYNPTWFKYAPTCSKYPPTCSSFLEVRSLLIPLHYILDPNTLIPARQKLGKTEIFRMLWKKGGSMLVFRRASLNEFLELIGRPSPMPSPSTIIAEWGTTSAATIRNTKHVVPNPVVEVGGGGGWFLVNNSRSNEPSLAVILWVKTRQPRWGGGEGGLNEAE